MAKMQSEELMTIGTVVLIAATLGYKSSFLHNKKIGYISLLQIFYLVLVPGLIYTIIFNYIIEVLSRPINIHVFLSDRLLTSILLLSVLYSYGGLAIHGICKTLSSYYTDKQKESFVYKVNKYFHFNFSHTLVYVGAVIGAGCFALLELNHVSPYPEESRLAITVLNGLFIGLAIIAATNWYKRQGSELKIFFFTFWAMFLVVVYAIKPYIKDIQTYPVALTMLIASSLTATLNVFLYMKRIKNKVKIVFEIPKKLLD